jgi:hypothetical protein
VIDKFGEREREAFSMLLIRGDFYSPIFLGIG